MTKPNRREFEREPRSHYFTRDESPATTVDVLSFKFMTNEYKFETGHGIFSKGGIDTGSRIMLQEFCKHEKPKPNAIILDLGCGYGIIGIVLAGTFEHANVDLVEINGKAAKFAARNILNNSIQNAEVHAIDFMDISQRQRALNGKKYDYILFNPPVKAGKETMSELIAEALSSLKQEGIMYIVMKTSLGAKTWQTMFQAREDVVLDVFREGGYRVFKLVLGRLMGEGGV